VAIISDLLVDSGTLKRETVTDIDGGGQRKTAPTIIASDVPCRIELLIGGLAETQVGISADLYKYEYMIFAVFTESPKEHDIFVVSSGEFAGTYTIGLILPARVEDGSTDHYQCGADRVK